MAGLLHVAPPVSARRWTLTVALAAALIAAGLFAFLYYRLTGPDRDSGAELLPANTPAVLLLSLRPLPGQEGIFRTIAAEMHRERLDHNLDDQLAEWITDRKLEQQIRPFLTGSVCIAIFNSPAHHKQADEDGVLLLSIRRPDSVRSRLQTGRRLHSLGQASYVTLGEFSAAVIKGYLALASRPEILKRIATVAGNRKDSLAALPAYRQARAALTYRTNLFLFASSSGVKQVSLAPWLLHSSDNVPARWFALSGTLQDQGVALDCRVALAPESRVWTSHLARATPLDPRLFERLPAQPYFLFADSQPSKYLQAALQPASGKRSGRSQPEWSDFEKQTGINVQRDVIPALRGQFTAAIYPDARGRSYGVDALLMLDGSHGATPGALLAKFRRLMEHDPTGEMKHFHLIPAPYQGATIWSPDAATQKKLAEGFRGLKSIGISERYLNDKTIVQAQSGQAALIATSEGMLEKSLDHYAGRAGGASAASNLQERLALGAQTVLVIDLGSLMAGVRSLGQYLQHWLEAYHFHVTSNRGSDDWVDLFGPPGSMMVLSAGASGTMGTGKAFIPLNYRLAVRIFGPNSRSQRVKTERV